jgi:hypothetical protein
VSASILEIGSTEEVALFNPAFLSRLLLATCNGWKSSEGQGMGVPIAFLAVPLALHRPTRDDLPRNAATQMQKWIRENPQHLAQFDKRVVSLRPFVGIALRYGLRHGVLVSDSGHLRPGVVKRRPRGFAELETDDVTSCLVASAFLGRWFARQPDTATSLAMWGLRP